MWALGQALMFAMPCASPFSLKRQSAAKCYSWAQRESHAGYEIVVFLWLSKRRTGQNCLSVYPCMYGSGCMPGCRCMCVHAHVEAGAEAAVSLLRSIHLVLLFLIFLTFIYIFVRVCASACVCESMCVCRCICTQVGMSALSTCAGQRITGSH